MLPLVLLQLLAPSSPALALDNGLAHVPPLGWNSDNYFGDDFPNFCLCDGIVAPKIRPKWLDPFCDCDCEHCPRTGPPHGLNHHYRMTEQAIRGMADAMVSSGMQKAGYRYINLDGRLMYLEPTAYSIFTTAIYWHFRSLSFLQSFSCQHRLLAVVEPLGHRPARPELHQLSLGHASAG